MRGQVAALAVADSRPVPLRGPVTIGFAIIVVGAFLANDGPLSTAGHLIADFGAVIGAGMHAGFLPLQRMLRDRLARTDRLARMPERS